MPIKSDRSGHITLVLGGTRSGKSSFAQHLAEESNGKLIYVATAEAFDDEMTDRIARHRLDRGPRWQTVEETLELTAAITNHSNQQTTLLVDCLTIWLSNVMLADRDIAIAMDELAQALANAPGPVILVSNEVGSGIVPESALGRQFRDEAGWMNQRIAAAADDVALITAGLPLWLKQSCS